MRRAAKVDDNQKMIVSQLRKIGCSVSVTSMIGKGFPDICVGWKGKNYLFEIKDGCKVKSKKTLTDHEQKFFDDWRGQVNKCESLEEICEILQIKLL